MVERRDMYAQRSSTPEARHDGDIRILHLGRSTDAEDDRVGDERWGDGRRRITYWKPTTRSWNYFVCLGEQA